MKIAGKYSHLNGLEFLLVNHPNRWKEIQEVIAAVNGDKCRIKDLSENRRAERPLYSPIAMKREMKTGFVARDWKGQDTRTGRTPVHSFNQNTFVKDRIAIEVRFPKNSSVYDLFAGHIAFFIGNVIDVGIEILPMKVLQAKMSSRIGYYERELRDVLRQGRGVPAVPLLLIGVIP